MAKEKTIYVCGCGATSAKWVGQCPGCGEWNTLTERAVSVAPARRHTGYAGAVSEVTTLDKVTTVASKRIPTGLPEFDRVLGGGLVPGAAVLLGGNPGAGKSTLLLQVACTVAENDTVLYVTGEESKNQLSDRAKRLGLPTDRLQVACETDVTVIANLIETMRPILVVVDSIQAVYHPAIDSAPGSVSQVRECAAHLNRLAKRPSVNSALLMVGHITKTDAIAGPMTLMHIVDATLMMSSTDDARFRVVRAEKNRHGDAAEIGIFAMTGKGLVEVPNPSAIFLTRSIGDTSGVVVTPLWEGSRPLLVEIQALADASALGNPRRVAVGLDGNRVAMLLAVLGRHGGLVVHDQDVYVNVAGGVKVSETSADLAVLLAIASSLTGRILRQDVAVFGEVGLSGEVRPAANGIERAREAAKLGFKTAVLPLANVTRQSGDGLELVPVATLAQALEWLSAQPMAAPTQAAS